MFLVRYPRSRLTLRFWQIITVLVVKAFVVLLLGIPTLSDRADNTNAHAATSESCLLTWTISPAPSVGRLYAVEALAANDVWAGGDVYMLHWDGTTWSRIAMPGASAIRGIAAVAPDDIWAVSVEGEILHWDGTAWKVETQINGSLAAIAAISPNDIWVVGSDPSKQPIALHWEGTTWNLIEPPSSTLHALAALSSNDVWAVGSMMDATAALHWNGTAWSLVPSLQGSPPDGPVFLAASASASDDVWAVGKHWWRPPAWFTIIGHWDGSVWKATSHPYGYLGTLNGVTALAPDDAWTVGWARYTRRLIQRPLMEHWDGKAWNIVALPKLDDQELNAIDAVSSQDLWAVGSKVWHGTLPCVSSKPAKPHLVSPVNGQQIEKQRMPLRWKPVTDAAWYEVWIKQGKKVVDRQMYLTTTRYKTKLLKSGHAYRWRVRACNSMGCTDFVKSSFQIIE